MISPCSFGFSLSITRSFRFLGNNTLVPCSSEPNYYYPCTQPGAPNDHHAAVDPVNNPYFVDTALSDAGVISAVMKQASFLSGKRGLYGKKIKKRRGKKANEWGMEEKKEKKMHNVSRSLNFDLRRYKKNHCHSSVCPRYFTAFYSKFCPRAKSEIRTDTDIGAKKTFRGEKRIVPCSNEKRRIAKADADENSRDKGSVGILTGRKPRRKGTSRKYRPEDGGRKEILFRHCIVSRALDLPLALFSSPSCVARCNSGVILNHITRVKGRGRKRHMIKGQGEKDRVDEVAQNEDIERAFPTQRGKDLPSLWGQSSVHAIPSGDVFSRLRAAIKTAIQGKETLAYFVAISSLVVPKTRVWIPTRERERKVTNGEEETGRPVLTALLRNSNEIMTTSDGTRTMMRGLKSEGTSPSPLVSSRPRFAFSSLKSEPSELRRPGQICERDAKKKTSSSRRTVHALIVVAKQFEDERVGGVRHV